MFLIFPYIFNQRAIKHSKCLAFVSSEFLTGVDTAEKTTALRTLEGNSCYLLLKTFLKNSYRYLPESWGKNNGRISITTVYSTGQQRCNSTMHNGVSILFRDYETRGLFSFFAILLSNRTCPTTLQVHLGKEQIIIILAGDTGWPKPRAVWTLGTFWRSQRCAISWQPTARTSELGKILLETPSPVQLGQGKSHDRVKEYFEQFLRYWVIKQLWWEEERKWEVCPTKYCSLWLFVRSLWANNPFYSFSQENQDVELTNVSSLWFLFTKDLKYLLSHKILLRSYKEWMMGW